MMAQTIEAKRSCSGKMSANFSIAIAVSPAVPRAIRAFAETSARVRILSIAARNRLTCSAAGDPTAADFSSDWSAGCLGSLVFSGSSAAKVPVVAFRINEHLNVGLEPD